MSFARALVDQISIDALAGDDDIQIGDGIGVPATRLVIGGDGNDTVFAGAGADTLLGGAGNDRFTSRNSLIDTLDGGAGTNSARLDGNDVQTLIQSILA